MNAVPGNTLTAVLDFSNVDDPTPPQLTAEDAAEDAARYFTACGYRAYERISVGWRTSRGGLTFRIVEVVDAPELIAEHLNTDVYISSGTLKNNVQPNSRGTVKDVGRMPALFADLDVKDGAFADKDQARRVIDDVSTVLGIRPCAVVSTGGGLQPRWKLTTRGLTSQTLARFGELVKRVAATHGGDVDNVYDLARILRAPGSINHKKAYGTPRPTKTRVLNSPRALTIPQLLAILDREGIPAEPTTSVPPAASQSPGKHLPNPRRNKYTAGAVEGVQRELRASADWPEGHKDDKGRGWEQLQFQSALRLAELAKADWNDLTLDQAQDAFLEAAPRDSKWDNGKVRDKWHGQSRAAKPADLPLDLVDPVVSEGLSTNLPSEFWKSRWVLGHIQKAAHAGLCSADAVLLSCLVQLSAMVSHELKMDTGIGDPASLNLIGALIGSSGAGKSTGANIATRLLERPGYLSNEDMWADPLIDPFSDGIPLGSGEGLAESFMGMHTVDVEVRDPKTGDHKKKSEKVRAQVRHNAYVYTDEGETLTKISRRDGATIGTALRSAWSGTTLGSQNATEERTRIVRGGTYSIGVLLGYQLGTAGALLADADGGTPQRVVFASAVDPSIPRTRVTERPASLSTETMLCENADRAPAGRAKPRTGVIDFPVSVKDELWEAQYLARTTDVAGDPLDAHAGLVRCKLAATLALLDGRGEVTEEDWRLAGMMWDTSKAVRAQVIDHGKAEAERAAEARDEAHINREVRTKAATTTVASKITRVARRLSINIHNKNVPQSDRDAQRMVPNRDRDVYSSALELALSEGWLIVDEDAGKIAPGPKTPSGV